MENNTQKCEPPLVAAPPSRCNTPQPAPPAQPQPALPHPQPEPQPQPALPLPQPELQPAQPQPQDQVQPEPPAYEIAEVDLDCDDCSGGSLEECIIKMIIRRIFAMFDRYKKSPDRQPWSTSLFGCFEDCGSCLLTICVPCITFITIAEELEEDKSSCVCDSLCYAICAAGPSLLGIPVALGCLFSHSYRKKLRERYQLEEGVCPDFMVHFCCELCALCQISREIKYQKKLAAKQAKKEAAAAMDPPAQATGMSR